MSPTNEYPANHLKPWTNTEEATLLDELKNNHNIDTIAQSHKRTPGGINARRRAMAYDMHNNGETLDNIATLTRLDINEINNTIKRRNDKQKHKQDKTHTYKQTTPTNKQPSPNDIATEINNMKTDISELKSMMIQLMKQMAAN